MLRRYFNYSAFEAEHVVPAFERELLVRQYVKSLEAEAGEDVPRGEPLSEAPGEFT